MILVCCEISHGFPWYCCSHAFLCQWPTVARHACCLWDHRVEKPKTSSFKAWNGPPSNVRHKDHVKSDPLLCSPEFHGEFHGFFHGESRRIPNENDGSHGWFHGKKICWVDVFASSSIVLVPSFPNGKFIAESSYSGCVISWLLLKQLQIMDWNQLEIWQRHIKHDIVVICCYRCFVNPRAFHFVQGILSSFYSCKTLAI